MKALKESGLAENTLVMFLKGATLRNHSQKLLKINLLVL